MPKAKRKNVKMEKEVEKEAGEHSKSWLDKIREYLFGKEEEPIREKKGAK